MTSLDPNSKLGREIRAGKLRAEKVVKRPGEDAADAFIRGMYERNPKEMKAFEEAVGKLIDGAKK